MCRIQTLDWKNSDLSLREAAIWGLEQRRNETKHIVGDQHAVHGQEEEWTVNPFSVPDQVLVVSQQVAGLCRVLGHRHEELSPLGPDIPVLGDAL